MKIKLVENLSDMRIFLDFHKVVYRDNRNYRLADEELVESLAKNKSPFHTHAQVLKCLLYDSDKVLGRFFLIHDERMPEIVQVAFLEFLPDTPPNLTAVVKEFAGHHFRPQRKICYGLNGHLNYGLGILTNRFHEPPLFGLPYSAEYYPRYFSGLMHHRIVTFRFQFNDMNETHEKLCSRVTRTDHCGITIRKLDSSNFEEAVRLYNQLNNACFKKHPFWSDRDYEEDFEVISPVRNLFINGNMIVAEYQGAPIAFLLWFPDFNQLLTSNFMELECAYPFSRHCREFKHSNMIDTLRVAEMGVIVEFQNKSVMLALFKAFIESIKDLQYKFCEGGFIFEENKPSMNLTRKFIQRFSGETPGVYRTFAIYEGLLAEEAP